MWHNYAKNQREMCILAMLCLLHRTAQCSLETISSYFLYKGYLKCTSIFPAELTEETLHFYAKRLQWNQFHLCSSVQPLLYPPYQTPIAPHFFLQLFNYSPLTSPPSLPASTLCIPSTPF